MNNCCLISRKIYKVNDDVAINIPTIGQIKYCEDKDDEQLFWEEVSLFTKVPTDMISELDYIGLDFETMSDYDLFTILFQAKKDSGVFKSILFKDFSLFDLDARSISGRVVLVDEKGKEIINEQVYNEISEIVCVIVGHEKTKKKKFGNAYAKKKRIEQDYKNKAKAIKSNGKAKHGLDMLDRIIIRLVCNANFPYDYDTIKNITIYELIMGLKQIDKDIQVTDLMQSRLVGNDLTKIPPEQLSRYIL